MQTVVAAEPDVSIVISSYDRVAMVGQAIASAFDQAGTRVEVVLVDDGSRDGTRAYLEREFSTLFEDGTGDPDAPRTHALPRLVYVHRENGGMSPALNTGLVRARGRYVKFLDSDDELCPDVLHAEVERADATGADVVVTAHEERTYEEGVEVVALRKRIEPPRVERGIDDFLEGRAPWTAAALYRRTSIARLRWDTTIPKTRDWAWAWAVCLSGARFVLLDVVSSLYKQHGGTRITNRPQHFETSTHSRQIILRRVEDALREQNAMTPERARALCQYYYKDSKTLAERSGAAWREVWQRCRTLAPGFRPREADRLAKPFVWLLGPHWGVRAFVRVRRLARACGLRRTRGPTTPAVRS